MSDPEITALAREYAEEKAKGTAVESLPDGFKENVIQRIADHFEKHLRWLTRHYCLVEKEKLKAIRFRKVYSAEDIRSKFTEECLIDALFPEIAKEVEG